MYAYIHEQAFAHDPVHRVPEGKLVSGTLSFHAMLGHRYVLDRPFGSFIWEPAWRSPSRSTLRPPAFVSRFLLCVFPARSLSGSRILFLHPLPIYSFKLDSFHRRSSSFLLCSYVRSRASVPAGTCTPMNASRVIDPARATAMVFSQAWDRSSTAAVLEIGDGLRCGEGLPLAYSHSLFLILASLWTHFALLGPSPFLTRRCFFAPLAPPRIVRGFLSVVLPFLYASIHLLLSGVGNQDALVDHIARRTARRGIGEAKVVYSSDGLRGVPQTTPAQIRKSASRVVIDDACAHEARTDLSEIQVLRTLEFKSPNAHDGTQGFSRRGCTRSDLHWLSLVRALGTLTDFKTSKVGLGWWLTRYMIVNCLESAIIALETVEGEASHNSFREGRRVASTFVTLRRGYRRFGAPGTPQSMRIGFYGGSVSNHIGDDLRLPIFLPLVLAATQSAVEHGFAEIDDLELTSLPSYDVSQVSLIFEGLAFLGQEQGKVVVVICPLKALQYDQAKQAEEKGLKAVVLNEDTTNSSKLWDDARLRASLIYISPEMASSDSFYGLWKDGKFRERLQAVTIDEAHCVDEWGGDDFRPDYAKLGALRTYTGMEVPFFACTATCRTETFDVLWDSLGYGSRPFWGLDVGVDRPNLLYIVRQGKQKDILLDIISILPSILDDGTGKEQLPKSIIYFDSEDACRQTVISIRKCLPKDLRGCAQAFSSGSSTRGKARIWHLFVNGEIYIVCATDAAGMGCNIKDIEVVISVGMPKTLSSLSQRWGRVGRDRTLPAVCILLVPPWALRPLGNASMVPTVQQLQQGQKRGRKSKLAEPKAWTVKRAKLETQLEAFLNVDRAVPSDCGHKFLRTVFRPRTRLPIYRTLTPGPNDWPSTDPRPRPTSYMSTWTVLDLGREPLRSRCCWACNPELLPQYEASTPADPRLTKYAKDFLYPAGQVPPAPPSTIASVASGSSASTNQKTHLKSNVPEPTPSELADLERRLDGWAKQCYIDAGSLRYSSPRIYLPPGLRQKFLNEVERHLSAKKIASEIGGNARRVEVRCHGQSSPGRSYPGNPEEISQEVSYLYACTGIPNSSITDTGPTVPYLASPQSSSNIGIITKTSTARFIAGPSNSTTSSATPA
ncbi:hypothetical protein NMY22_g19060 [Coprinellus aureogranulatus]|nr:hypothetical protein NMY22_g19060 [Coprinellus aureogranulatus]